MIAWCGITIAWSTVLVLSCLPVLVDMSVIAATIALTNSALLIFLGLTAGFMWRLQIYYHNRKVEDATWGTLVFGSLIFLCTAGASVVTGFWL
jgi:hypothetical protein